MKRQNLIAMLCAILVCGWITAAEDTPPPAEKPDEQTIQKLVKQLDSDDFDEREAAQAKLIEVGTPAKAALEVAAKKNGEDFKYRAAFLCRIFELRDKLSTKLRKAHVGIEEELVCDKKSWLKYFMEADTPNKEENDCCFSKSDMEVLGAGVLRGLEGLEDKEIIIIFVRIRFWDLRKLIPKMILCLKNKNDRVRSSAADEYTRKESINSLEPVAQSSARLL